MTSDRCLDLAKGEVDIALRSGDTEDGGLAGRENGDSLWAVYASRAYVEHHSTLATVGDLQNHLIVGFDESTAGHRAAQWLRRVAPDARIAAAFFDFMVEEVAALRPIITG